MRKQERLNMILTINTIDRNSIEIGIFQNDELRCFDFETERQSEDLLVVIEGILKKEKLSLQDIDSILVNQGPGSFTSDRVEVTVANTLGWSLNIPVFGYKNDDLEKNLLKIAKLKIKNFSQIVLPFYDK